MRYRESVGEWLVKTGLDEPAEVNQERVVWTGQWDEPGVCAAIPLPEPSCEPGVYRLNPVDKVIAAIVLKWYGTGTDTE